MEIGFILPFSLVWYMEVVNGDHIPTRVILLQEFFQLLLLHQIVKQSKLKSILPLIKSGQVDYLFYFTI